jgi:CDP-diacylglycerol--serine O-phosphatidyltransferase
VFVVCVAMRLARFNIQRLVVDKRYFAGLPSPAAGASLACLVYAFPEPVSVRWVSGGIALLTASVATLTISRIRYRSFKDVDLRNRRSYLFVFPLAVIVVAILTQPEAALPGLAAVYVLSGPVSYAFTLARRRRPRVPPGEVFDEPFVR